MLTYKSSELHLITPVISHFQTLIIFVWTLGCKIYLIGNAVDKIPQTDIINNYQLQGLFIFSQY
jgi:hypothetical protein